MLLFSLHPEATLSKSGLCQEHITILSEKAFCSLLLHPMIKVCLVSHCRVTSSISHSTDHCTKQHGKHSNNVHWYSTGTYLQRLFLLFF